MRKDKIIQKRKRLRQWGHQNANIQFHYRGISNTYGISSFRRKHRCEAWVFIMFHLTALLTTCASHRKQTFSEQITEGRWLLLWSEMPSGDSTMICQSLSKCYYEICLMVYYWKRCCLVLTVRQISTSRKMTTETQMCTLISNKTLTHNC